MAVSLQRDLLVVDVGVAVELVGVVVEVTVELVVVGVDAAVVHCSNILIIPSFDLVAGGVDKPKDLSCAGLPSLIFGLYCKLTLDEQSYQIQIINKTFSKIAQYFH